LASDGAEQIGSEGFSVVFPWGRQKLSGIFSDLGARDAAYLRWLLEKSRKPSYQTLKIGQLLGTSPYQRAFTPVSSPESGEYARTNHSTHKSRPRFSRSLIPGSLSARYKGRILPRKMIRRMLRWHTIGDT